MLSTLLLEINIGFIIRGKFSCGNIIMHADVCSCHSENPKLLGATCMGPRFLHLQLGMCTCECSQRRLFRFNKICDRFCKSF